MNKAFLLIIVTYIIAVAAAMWLFQYLQSLNNQVLLNSLLADVAATIIVFTFSSAFKNASFYDPYWSVIPPLLIILWYSSFELQDHAAHAGSVRFYLLQLVVSLWAIRLTLNWIRRWKGLGDEDFRYQDLRSKTGLWFPLVNLLGIHLFPTLIVFAAMLPAYYSICHGSSSLHFTEVVATLICLSAIFIEWIADEQLKQFLKRNSGSRKFLSTGLWRYSRHPNYFGEVLFWWGIFLFVLAADPAHWWTIVGAIAMSLMFLFISIPLMDKRMMERRPEYAGHMKKIAALIPWIK